MFSAPLEVCLGITSGCNLNCKHCENRIILNAEPDLTTAELFKVIDQLGQAKVFNLTIFGGEPLVHPDFFPIASHLSKYPFLLYLVTNATLIDRSTAKQLKKHKINNAVVSFDGSRPEIMDEIRGAGTFRKTIKGTEALLSEGISVVLAATLSKINYKDIKGLVLLGKELGVKQVRFNILIFIGNAACFTQELYLPPDEETQVSREIWQLREELPDFIHMDSSFLAQKLKIDGLKNYQPAADKIIVPPCGAAEHRCYIRPDGWVTPCEAICEEKCGNIKAQSLTEIWKSFAMEKFRQPMEIDLDEIPECRNCQGQFMCFIGHRCFPYYYRGGVKNRSLYCWMKKDKEKALIQDE